MKKTDIKKLLKGDGNYLKMADKKDWEIPFPESFSSLRKHLRTGKSKIKRKENIF